MGSLKRFRGNTHAHTTLSDGDLPPDEVVGWYREHGYDFLFITDHNRLTDVDGLSTPGFLVMPGCEVGVNAEGKPIHVNALNCHSQPATREVHTISEALQMEVDASLAAGGVPQVNHPNWVWAFTHVQMTGLTGCCLLEVFNASTDCNNFGAGGMPSVEDTWDRLLSMGRRYYGLASDDAHDYKGQFWGRCSPPGRGWVDVWADELSPAAILDALQAGRFYASTEVTLAELLVSADAVRLRIEQVDDYRYTTTFVGRDGRVLAERYGTEPEYQLRGDEGYIRARVFSSNGGYAWTQPIFVDGRP
jgi:hypothetical protein